MSSPKQPSAPTGETGKLCTWISTVTLDDIPSEVKTRAKYLILDGIACALVGAHLPWSEKAANAISAIEPQGNCDIFGYEKKLGPLSAALLNSSFIQGFELDDWHTTAPLHSNSILLPALFAAASHLKNSHPDSPPISGETFLLAYLVGLEVGPRVGLALYGSQILSRGWHSGAVFGPSASAAAASKMLGLSADLVEDALGMACTQACGLMSAQFESEVKRMQHGFAARNGLFGALMAQQNYIGIKQVYERPYGGFLSVFGAGSGQTPESLPEEISKDLDEKWQSDDIRIKPYASMAATFATIDLIKKLQTEHPARMRVDRLQDVQSVVFEMTSAAFHHGGWEATRPLTSLGAQMNCAFVAATQWVEGQVLPAQLREEKLRAERVWELVGKMRCVEFGEGGGHTYRQRATVGFADGEVVVVEVEAPRAVEPGLTNEEILEKWRGLMEGVIGGKRREGIEGVCLGLEGVEDVLVLSGLMAGRTGNPIA